MLNPIYAFDIAEATGGTIVCGDRNAVIKSVSTDSRCLDDNTLFIPIKGERFDGHDFIKNAKIAVSSEDVEVPDGVTLIKTGDTVKAFGDIARFYKRRYPVPTVSVVGSVGKTTTRDMIASVLSQKYRTLKTEKNYNNDIGVPIMVMKLEDCHEMAVLELGMSALGEIEYLADIVRPDTLVMTNIGMSHIENLGSQDNIFKAKMEGTHFLTPENTVIANFDDKYLKTVRNYGDYKVVSYAVENDADVRAMNVTDKGFDGVDFDVMYDNTVYRVHLNIPGVHNVYNALAAFAAGIVHGVSPEDIAAGLRDVDFTAMRMEVTNVGGIKIINDCYNASPSSVEAGLKVLGAVEGSRRVAVLGDMLELGNFVCDAHSGVGKLAGQYADVVVCAGENSAYIAEFAKQGAEVVYFTTTDEAAEKINGIVREGDTVLIKASRGMHFEKIFNKITEGRN